MYVYTYNIYLYTENDDWWRWLSETWVPRNSSGKYSVAMPTPARNSHASSVQIQEPRTRSPLHPPSPIAFKVSLSTFSLLNQEPVNSFLDLCIFSASLCPSLSFNFIFLYLFALCFSPLWLTLTQDKTIDSPAVLSLLVSLWWFICISSHLSTSNTH